MKKFFTHPTGIIITLVIVAIAAYYIGTGQWLKNILASKPAPPADGTACTDASGNAGTFKKGVCIATNLGGGAANPVSNERIQTYPPSIAVPRGAVGCQKTYPYGGVLYQFTYAIGKYCYYKRP